MSASFGVLPRVGVLHRYWRRAFLGLQCPQGLLRSLRGIVVILLGRPVVCFLGLEYTHCLRRALPSPCVCSLKSQEPSLPYACMHSPHKDLSVLTTGLCVGPSQTSKTLKASVECITQACGVLFLSFLKHLLHNNGFL